MAEIQPLHFPEASPPLEAGERSPFPFAGMAHDAPHAPANRLEQLESMLKEAQSRAEIIEKEAYDKAYLAGEKAGMALGRKRGEQILESLQHSLKHADAQIDRIRQGFADAALDLARFIAMQILEKEILETPETLVRLAQQAAEQIPAEGELKVAVHPDDLDAFERLMEKPMPLRPDPALRPGTCRIISETQDALVDPLHALQSYVEQLRDSFRSTAAPVSSGSSPGISPQSEQQDDID